MNPYPVTPPNWKIFQHSNIGLSVQRAPGLGIQFDFPVSPKPDPDATGPWAGYLAHEVPGNSPFMDPKKKHPIKGAALYYEFEVIASPGTIWNFKSEEANTGDHPAAVTPWFRSGLFFDESSMLRWWCTTARYNLKAGIATLVATLDPSQWIDVTGQRASDSPELLSAFQTAIAGPTFIGLTFGGGFFYGHGVNVSSGTARFMLRKVYSA